MLHNKHIFMGALCATAMIQSASSSEAPTITAPSCLRLEDCFIQESMQAPGPSLCYAPFVSSVEIGKFTQHPSKPVRSYSALPIVAGVAGIVEGSDTELTQEVAKSVKHLLTVCGIRFDEEKGGFPKSLKKHNKMCLEEALRKVIAGNFDRHKRASDIKLKAVWFRQLYTNMLEEGPSKKYLVEFGEKKRVGHILNNMILPTNIEEQLKAIELCCTSAHFTQEARLKVLDRYIATHMSEHETHEATVLRFDLDRCRQLLEQNQEEAD